MQVKHNTGSNLLPLSFLPLQAPVILRISLLSWNQYKKKIYSVSNVKSFLSKEINFGMKWHCELRNSCKAFMFMSPFNISCNFSRHFLVSKAQVVEILMFYKCLYNSFNFRVIYSCVKQAVFSVLCLSTVLMQWYLFRCCFQTFAGRFWLTNI